MVIFRSFFHEMQVAVVRDTDNESGLYSPFTLRLLPRQRAHTGKENLIINDNRVYSSGNKWYMREYIISENLRMDKYIYAEIKQGNFLCLENISILAHADIV